VAWLATGEDGGAVSDSDSKSGSGSGKGSGGGSDDGAGSDSDTSAFAKFLKEHGHKRELKPCLGDTRYKKNICQHMGFRFCMRLVNDDGSPYIFGDRDGENSTERDEDVNEDGLDWWEWSTQPQHKDSWLAGIVKTGGHRWCTCALCTSEAVDRFGCENLDIQCDATDVAFLRYRVEHDHHNVLKSGWECLKQKCGEDYQKDWPIVGHDCKHRGCARLYGAGYENALMPLEEAWGRGSTHSATNLAIMTIAAALVSLVAGVSLWRHRAAVAAAPLPTTLLSVEAEEVDAAVE